MQHLQPRHLSCSLPKLPGRSETYQYYNLPFCTPPGGKQYILEDLGEVLEGDRLVKTPYNITFTEDVDNRVLCNKTLDAKDLTKLRKAIADDYYFQVSPRHSCSSSSNSSTAGRRAMSRAAPGACHTGKAADSGNSTTGTCQASVLVHAALCGVHVMHSSEVTAEFGAGLPRGPHACSS